MVRRHTDGFMLVSKAQIEAANVRHRRPAFDASGIRGTDALHRFRGPMPWMRGKFVNGAGTGRPG